MNDVSIDVWLASAYAAFLVLAAYGLDVMAERASRRTSEWRTGAFRYHADHDAWVCPQDQWLWPQSFDPHHRVMRYRASPTVCNSCPAKSGCTTSSAGREVSRPVDPWPHSEAGRFHRGLACALTVLAVALPLALMIGSPARDAVVLAGTAALAGMASWPLWLHLRRSPADFAGHLPVDEPVAAPEAAHEPAGWRMKRS